LTSFGSSRPTLCLSLARSAVRACTVLAALGVFACFTHSLSRAGLETIDAKNVIDARYQIQFCKIYQSLTAADAVLH